MKLVDKIIHGIQAAPTWQLIFWAVILVGYIWMCSYMYFKLREPEED